METAVTSSEGGGLGNPSVGFLGKQAGKSRLLCLIRPISSAHTKQEKLFPFVLYE